MNTELIGLLTFIRREVRRFLRVSVQTLVSPWISATLFIFIFGGVVGSRIATIGGVPYITFVLPGILMMNVLTATFSHTSSSLYFHRFARHIEEILVSPLSYTDMILGYLMGALVRGVFIGGGILIIGLLFGATSILHPFWFLVYLAAVSVLFALLGLVVGLWADGFEQLASLTTFIITPLSFLGGMFNTLDMLPPVLRTATLWNPFFYFNDGLRFSMTGIHEAPLSVGLIVIGCLTAVCAALVLYLFRTGWHLRA